MYGHLTENDEKRDAFLEAERRLTQIFLLVKHLDECRVFADEIIFYQLVRNQLNKIEHRGKSHKELETAVRDLVDQSIETAGVADIFQSAGIERADVSILDDEFLQTHKDKPLEIFV